MNSALGSYTGVPMAQHSKEPGEDRGSLIEKDLDSGDARQPNRSYGDGQLRAK